MTLKNIILILLRCIGINLLLLIVAAMSDILLTLLMIGYSFRALTITCFGVAGVFSAAYCYAPVIDRTNKEKRDGVALYLLVCIAVLCAFFFAVFAPLSGWDYDWPVKLFAIAELVTVIFFRATRLYRGL
jgi:hypothetical protein